MVAALGLCAPMAHAQSREQQQLISELRILEEQTQRLQLTINALADQVKGLKDQAKDNADRLDQIDRQATKGFADEATRINSLAQTVTNVQEKQQDNSARLQQLDQEITPIRQSLGMLTDAVNQIQQQFSGTAPPPGAGPASATSPPGSAMSVAASPTAYYQSALTLYVGGEFDLAIKGFRNFLDQFPSAPNACEAQYHIGKSDEALKHYSEAVADFDVILKAYPGTDCEPEALFAQGQDYEVLKNIPKALEKYKLIVDRATANPSDDWVTVQALANQRIKALKPGGN
jgi:TolA-binding protein